MFILLKIGLTAVAAVLLAAIILISIAATVLRRMHPEKKRKPLKRI
jgi:hypothetical protein